MILSLIIGIVVATFTLYFLRICESERKQIHGKKSMVLIMGLCTSVPYWGHTIKGWNTAVSDAIPFVGIALCAVIFLQIHKPRPQVNDSSSN